MDLYTLRPGDRVRTIDGATAHVVAPTQDGKWIKIRYETAPDSSIVGTEDLAHRDEISKVPGQSRANGGRIS